MSKKQLVTIPDRLFYLFEKRTAQTKEVSYVCLLMCQQGREKNENFIQDVRQYELFLWPLVHD